jgi:hypothetical protein
MLKAISPLQPTASISRFRCLTPDSSFSDTSAMANQQCIRFAIRGDSELRSLHAYISRADMNSPPPACLTLTENALHDKGTDNNDAASNTDPPTSLLESAPLYIPTAEEDEIHGCWGPPSPQATAAGDLAGAEAPEPSNKRKLWLPTLRQVINIFAGRRGATRSRPYSLSAVTTGTASPSSVPNQQEELPCPTDPIWIPGQEPSWRDAWYADGLWGDLYPAPSHPTTGYAWVEEDIFVPEVVQRGFHVSSRQPDESSSRSPPAQIFVDEPASEPAGKGKIPLAYIERTQKIWVKGHVKGQSAGVFDFNRLPLEAFTGKHDADEEQKLWSMEEAAMRQMGHWW